MSSPTAGPLPWLDAELQGLGPLQALAGDPAVTDVLVNAPDDVWADRGDGLSRATARFADEDAVRRLAVRLVAASGRRLDLAMPFADAQLPDGTRVHAVLPPISARGTALSLRFLRRHSFDLPALVAANSISVETAQLLRQIVDARLALVVSGGTGSGKTTLLGVLLGLVDPRERLVLVEDASELQVEHPHAVRLQCRVANVEGAGEITLRDLVRQSLRMRPDRIVVGEVRGAEVLDLLTALNTGHDGSMTSVHANSAAEVPARLEALAALAGMPRASAHSQLAAGVQVLLHLARRTNGQRVLAEIAVLRRQDSGEVRAAPAWRRESGPAEGMAELRCLLALRGR